MKINALFFLVFVVGASTCSASDSSTLRGGSVLDSLSEGSIPLSAVDGGTMTEDSSVAGRRNNNRRLAVVINSFNLAKVVSGTVVDTFTGKCGTLYKICRCPFHTILATTTEDTESVKFTITDPFGLIATPASIESVMPYTAAGPIPLVQIGTPGTYTVAATPYPRNGALGTPGETRSITFEVILCNTHWLWNPLGYDCNACIST